MNELDALKRLYGDDEGNAMNDEIRRRPQVGEYVTVGDLPGVFRVLDFDGRTFVLESEHGTRCRAGVWVVRLAAKEAA